MQNKLYQLNENISYLNLEDNDFIVIIGNKPTWLKTTSTGKEILDFLKKPRSFNEVMEYLLNEYDISRDTIEPIIKNSIDEFIDAGVITEVNKKKEVKPLPCIKDLPLQQLWFNITNACNLTCAHCFARTKREKKFVDLKNALKLIKEAKDMQIDEIVFSGGEPTLHPDLEKMLIEASQSEKNIKIKLLTNGYLAANEEGQQRLLNLVKYLDDIQVSIDGIDKEINDKIRGEGSYELACNTFEILSKTDVKVGLSLTPLPENIDTLKDLYKFAINYNVDYIHFNRVKKPAGNEYNNDYLYSLDFSRESYKLFDELYKEYVKIHEDMRGMHNVKYVALDHSFDPGNELITSIKKERCSAGFLTIAVNPNGDAYPCAALSREKSLRFGNVFENGLENVYKYGRKIMEEIFSVDKNEKCSKCMFRYFCGGGCRATAIKINEPDYYCDVMQERFIDFFDRLSLPVIKTFLNKEEFKVSGGMEEE